MTMNSLACLTSLWVLVLINGQQTFIQNEQCSGKMLQKIMDQQQLILEKLLKLENKTEEISEELDNGNNDYGMK